ncbi:MAG: hypothetical protein JNK89_03585 [Saprospiraceae bacterium]|nr:hypothetical protein [Saprospiraceae bacterium]
MQQHDTRFRAGQLSFALVFLICLVAGCDDPACRPLSGRWSTREGQSFCFLENGHALWLVRFGSQVDTVHMEYRYDCQKSPAQLDLKGFSAGPLVGQALYGILEWNSDTSFRFYAEVGAGPEMRPVTFESDQTQKFFLEK